MTLLSPALDLAGRGFRVFNLMPSGYPWRLCTECRSADSRCVLEEDHEACGHVLCHGYIAGTTKPERLEEMWRMHPDGIIGLRTGGGLIVMDFDQHPGQPNGLPVLTEGTQTGHFAPTMSCYTSGGGIHAYYNCPIRIGTCKPWPGVDCKGEGGYVVVPPSAKTGKPAYRWIEGHGWDSEIAGVPHNLRVRLERIGAEAQLDFSTLEVYEDEPFFDDDDTPWSSERLDYQLGRLLRSYRHGRNMLLFRAACTAGALIERKHATESEMRAKLTMTGLDAGLTKAEVRNTVRQGLRRGKKDERDSAARPE